MEVNTFVTDGAESGDSSQISKDGKQVGAQVVADPAF